MCLAFIFQKPKIPPLRLVFLEPETPRVGWGAELCVGKRSHPWLSVTFRDASATLCFKAQGLSRFASACRCHSDGKQYECI
jgi:hypothetical protein